jgi:deoxycytidylate deaminase
MKEKHIQARINQCLAIAACSPCTRRKFGALLLDPVRNVLLMDGYNGGPRDGGEVCGGTHCLRDGFLPQDVVLIDSKGLALDDPKADREAGLDDDSVRVRVKDRFLVNPKSQETSLIREYGFTFWRNQALAVRDRLLAANPPIPSGTRMEVGCHHAEMNVICNAAATGVTCQGAWLIVTGEPCILCAKLIHHAGIVKVLCVQGGYAGGDAGVLYLQQHGVEVSYVEGPQDPRLEKACPP